MHSRCYFHRQISLDIPVKSLKKKNNNNEYNAMKNSPIRTLLEADRDQQQTSENKPGEFPRLIHALSGRPEAVTSLII